MAKTKFDPDNVIAITIALVIAFALMPVALAAAAAAEAANWGASGIVILGLLGVVIAASLLYGVYKAFK